MCFHKKSQQPVMTLEDYFCTFYFTSTTFLKMKSTVLLIMALGLSVVMRAQTPLTTSLDSASYAFGLLVGDNLMRQMPAGLNPDIIMNGMSAALKKGPKVFDEQTANQIFTAFAQKAQETAMAESRKMGEANRAASQKFLEDNKKRAGVTTTPSGLQYEVLKRGAGTESPKESDQVKVHYHGTTTDGAIFDSSVDRGEPIVFGLNQVISGWTEGLQLMHVGDKFKFYIPADLAYGDQSPTPAIQPGSTLIFEVELFEINPK